MDSYLRIGSTSSIFMECVYGNSCVVGEGVDQWMSVGRCFGEISRKDVHLYFMFNALFLSLSHDMSVCGAEQS